MAKVEIKSNIVLNKWQSDVIQNVISHGKGYTHIVKAKRQVGKSVMLEVLLLKYAIENKATTSYLLSPTFEQARKIFNELKDIVKPTPIYERHNDLQLLITLKNRSKIVFKSAEQKDGLRGYTCTGIYCIDEGVYISDEVFYETLAWVNVSKAPVVVVSTPKYKTGFFYKYYLMGLENGNSILSYNWGEYDTSALLSNEKLEEYRKNVPTQIFTTEYLGEFLDNEGSVFVFDKALKNVRYIPNENTYMGIDWGTGQGQDETAISIFNRNGNMVGLYHFSDKDEMQTINYIVELIKQYKPLKVQVESNSIGQIFYGLLDKAIKANHLPVQLLRFTTTNETKERLINKFQVALQNEQVTILNDSVLQVQLTMYEMKLTNNGKRTYNAASGYHDDCVIATLLGYDCISKGIYMLR